MKKIVAMVLISLSFLLYAQDFRRTSWGMSKDAVAKTETTGRIGNEEEGALNYTVSINNYELKLQYIFTKSDKLCGASYFRDFTDNNYMDSYKKQKSFFLVMKNGLDLKYGNPTFVNKDDDIFVFVDYKSKELKKYVNDEIDTFLDINESTYSIDNKNLTKNIFNIGYTYCLKYSTDTTIIYLMVQQKGEDIHQEIMYWEKNDCKNMNDQIKKNIIDNSGL